jgi:hypothetical protein
MSRTFDVIVGNPPFQQNANVSKNTSTNKLWIRFLNLAVNRCVTGGYIAFITPQAVMAPNESFKLMTSKQIIYTNTHIGQFFPSVNSSFSAWVMRNENGTGKIMIDGKVIDTKPLGLVPNDRSDEGLSILKKMWVQTPKLLFKRTCKHHSQNGEKNPNLFGEKSAKHPFPILESSSEKSHMRWSSVEGTVQHEKKVVIFRSGYLGAMYDSSSGTGSGAYFHIVKSQKDGRNLVEILKSKAFTYLLETTKHSGYFHRVQFENLPYLDYSRSWTDAEIYEHFNITKKEQAHIEAYLG